jgi:hypothetical protein
MDLRSEHNEGYYQPASYLHRDAMGSLGRGGPRKRFFGPALCARRVV